MGTITEELKKLYAKLGGTDPNIPKASTPGEVLNGLNELELGGDKLPEVTEADNGKALGVKQGKWDKMDVDIELPEVTTDDNGKVLMVSEGNWGKGDLPSVGDIIFECIGGGLGGKWTLKNSKTIGDIFSVLNGDIKTNVYLKGTVSVNYNAANIYLKCTEWMYLGGVYRAMFVGLCRWNFGSIEPLRDTTIIEAYIDNSSPNRNDIVTSYRNMLPPVTSSDNGSTLSVVNGTWAKTAPKTWSTTEHVVGKWIDGTTDVYERSFHVDGLSGAPYDWESMFEVNVADIVRTEGSTHKSNGEIISIENSGFRVCANPQVHPGYMCYHFTDSSVTEFTVTVQYTKAT